MPESIIAKDALDLAIEMADTARKITLSYFGGDFDVETKADQSPVTMADRQTEKRLREMIHQQFPDDGIFGEEFGEYNTDAEYVWIIDPIDGTGSFVFGIPLYGCLISRLKNNIPQLGIIDMPAIDQRWIGNLSKPSIHNKSECKTSRCEELSQARLMCTTPDMFNAEEAVKFEHISQQVAMRRFGGDCFCYGLLSSGQIDLVVESDLKPYDFLALVTIVEGAGGVITDWHGRPLTMSSGNQVIAAATAELHSAAIEILSS